MNVNLTRQESHAASVRGLEPYYRDGLIPAEKKPFLVDLKNSKGPFLAIEGGEAILDLASQIASVGLGFNAGPLFGVPQYLEAWIEAGDTSNVRAVRDAYSNLLRRKLDWPDMAMHVASSGTEAIEMALGDCYDRCDNPQAKKVLAFEGSFHGRMLVALSATWNPQKREPFAWPGFESAFVPYPEMEGDSIETPEIPEGWIEFWQRGTIREDDVRQFQKAFDSDSLLVNEIESLWVTHRQLGSGDFFALLIEPMQCEGGDRYSSARFHHGLMAVAQAFGVPLIYDEIQTGFGLGRHFFWHRQFDREDRPRLTPDYVVCAKKAQVGLVLSHHPLSFAEAGSVGSLVRGMIQASMLDQFDAQIERIESFVRPRLVALIDRYESKISRPRIRGLAFAFDFADSEAMSRFVANRFRHGILYYPAGERTARFRMNLSMRDAELELAWQQLESALAETLDGTFPSADSVSASVSKANGYLNFQRMSFEAKLATLRQGSRLTATSVVEFIKAELPSAGLDVAECQVFVLEPDDYPEYRDRIMQMQRDVYEPARQTGVDDFDRIFKDANHTGIVVVRDEQLIGMAFGGRLGRFPEVSGTAEDPFFEDPTVNYMVDLTVAEGFRGKLGKVLKQAIVLLGMTKELSAIHGRNRDRLARGMWAINLSLGSYETQYLEDNYNDDYDFRDCYYYRCPIEWQRPQINLSSGIRSPLGYDQLDAEFFEAAWPALVNKLTLSNFVDRNYLENLRNVLGQFPEGLRHGYSASGLSECVDKVVKSIWLVRQPRKRLLSIEGNYFGDGSFLARGLSGLGKPFFDVGTLPVPSKTGQSEFVERLERELATDSILAFFVEPLGSRTMERMDEDRLAEIRRLCRQYDVPLVFNDSASLFYRYSNNAFAACGIPEIEPDATIAYLGGQMGVVGCNSSIFCAAPLKLISTWDGDAYQLAAFCRAMEIVEREPSEYFSMMAEYDRQIKTFLEEQSIDTSQLTRGIGWFAGSLPAGVADCFEQGAGGRYLSCPSPSQMKQWLHSRAHPTNHGKST